MELDSGGLSLGKSEPDRRHSRPREQRLGGTGCRAVLGMADTQDAGVNRAEPALVRGLLKS